MNDPALKRGALEDLWRERARASLDLYRLAVDECERTMKKGPMAASLNFRGKA